MESTLAWISLGVGILATILAFLEGLLLAPSPRGERPPITPALLLGIVLTVILFLLTLPSQPPFSAGLRLGWGFLIGAVAMLLAVFAGVRIGRPDCGYWPYPSGLVMPLLLTAVSMVMLLFRGDPTDALVGCALGVVMVAGVMRTTLPDDAAEGVDARAANASVLALSQEAGAVVAVTIAAGCALAVYHFDESTLRGWWVYPLAVTALWVVGQTIANLVCARPSLARYSGLWPSAAAGLSFILVLVVGWRLGAKLQPAESLELLLIGGSITAGLVLWLGLALKGMPWSRALQSNALAVALVIFLVVVSFKLLAGFGAAVALLAAWGIAGAVLGLKGVSPRMLAQALAAGASLLLLRLFLERSGSVVGETELSLHYTLVGVIIGVLLPFVYSSLRLRWGVGRTLLVGGLGAASPVVLLTLWGPDAALGLLAGLVGAQAIALLLMPLSELHPEIAIWHAPVATVALLAGLVAVQFTQPFAFLYEMPRIYKAYVAGGVALAVIIWLVVLGLTQAFARSRQSSAAAPAAGPEA
jgi:hypothetical protein